MDKKIITLGNTKMQVSLSQRFIFLEDVVIKYCYLNRFLPAKKL